MRLNSAHPAHDRASPRQTGAPRAFRHTLNAQFVTKRATVCTNAPARPSPRSRRTAPSWRGRPRRGPRSRSATRQRAGGARLGSVRWIRSSPGSASSAAIPIRCSVNWTDGLKWSVNARSSVSRVAAQASSAGHAGVVPVGRHDRREDAVLGLRQRRVAVAVEAREARARGAQHEQLVDAAGVADAQRVGLGDVHAGAAGAALPGVRVEPLPRVLAQPHGGELHRLEAGEVARQRGGEVRQRAPASGRRRRRRRRCASCRWPAGRSCRRRRGPPRSRPRRVTSAVRSRSRWRSAPRVTLTTRTSALPYALAPRREPIAQLPR